MDLGDAIQGALPELREVGRDRTKVLDASDYAWIRYLLDTAAGSAAATGVSGPPRPPSWDTCEAEIA